MGEEAQQAAITILRELVWLVQELAGQLVGRLEMQEAELAAVLERSARGSHAHLLPATSADGGSDGG